MEKRPDPTLPLESEPTDGHRARIRQIVDSVGFQALVVIVILTNAVTLGLESFAPSGSTARVLELADLGFVAFFLAELLLRLVAYGRSYFRSGWNVFDFIIIVGSVFAQSNTFAALRAFRVLRVLRVITAIPRMRTVVQSLFEAIPGILSVAVVAMLVIYIFAVIGTTLYGEAHPDIFGNVIIAMYTLFQIITLEGWRDLADQVQATHSTAWIYFISFVLVGTFTMLNLFIAIVVKTVEDEANETEDVVREEADQVQDTLAEMAASLKRLEERVEALSTGSDERRSPDSG